MPGFDGRGPRGRGPGKGYGPCGRGMESTNLKSEDKIAFLEKKTEKLEKKNKLLCKTIKELKSK